MSRVKEEENSEDEYANPDCLMSNKIELDHRLNKMHLCEVRIFVDSARHIAKEENRQAQLLHANLIAQNGIIVSGEKKECL